MRKDYFRYYKPGCLITTILFLSVIWGMLIELASKRLEDFLFLEPYIQLPVASVFIIGVLKILDKWGLRIPLLKRMFWIKDISGRYEGSITYKHFKTKEIETKDCFLEITQKASAIKVDTYFDFKDSKEKEKTESNSIVTSIEKDDTGDLSLVFTYQNNGSNVLNLPSYYGTNILRINYTKDGIFLDGTYYTNRIPKQTKGEMSVKFISKNLKRKF